MINTYASPIHQALGFGMKATPVAQSGFFNAPRLRTSTYVFDLPTQTGAPFIMRETLNRVGMVICNPDVAIVMFMKFGSPIQVVGSTYDGIQLLPNEKRVMDVITPTEALYMMSNVSGSQVIIEETVLS